MLIYQIFRTPERRTVHSWGEGRDEIKLPVSGHLHICIELKVEATGNDRADRNGISEEYRLRYVIVRKKLSRRWIETEVSMNLS